MSDPYDISWASNTGPATEGIGPGFFSSLATNFEAAQDKAFHVDAQLGLPADIHSRWEDTIKAYQQKGGKVTDGVTNFNDLWGMLQDRQITSGDPLLSSVGSQILARAFANPSKDAEVKANIQRINEELKQLNDPTMPSLDAIIKEQLNKQDAIEQVAGQASNGAGVSGFLGRLTGGLSGALGAAAAGRDPLQAATLIIGAGEAKTVAGRITNEVLANAAAGALIQGASINPQRELRGKESGSVVEAALFGGLLGGAVGGLGALASRALRGRAPEIALHETLAAHPEDPAARAGLSLLDDQTHFDASNPYGHTETGMRVFTGELEDVVNLFEGRTSTAVAWFMPNEPVSLGTLDMFTTMVKDEKPHVFDQLNVATDTLTALDEQIAVRSSALDNLTIGDAIQQVGGDTAAEIARLQEFRKTVGDGSPQALRTDARLAALEAEAKTSGLPDPAIIQRIGEIEAELKATRQHVPTLEHHRLAKELDGLVKQAGERRLETAMAGLEQGHRLNLQLLRQQRIAAVKEFNRARDVMDREIAKAKANVALRDLRSKGLKKTAPNLSRADMATQAAKTLSDTVEATPDRVLKIFEKVEKPAEGEPIISTVPDDMLDLGNGRLVPKDFELTLNGEKVTAGKAWADAQDGAALEEATRICSV